MLSTFQNKEIRNAMVIKFRGKNRFSLIETLEQRGGKFSKISVDPM